MRMRRKTRGKTGRRKRPTQKGKNKRLNSFRIARGGIRL